MSSLHYSDVVEITRDAAKQSLLITFEDLKFPATAWQPFAIAPLVVELAAENRVKNSQYAAFFRDAFLIENSSGEMLTRLARSEFSIERNLALETQIVVTITCATGNGPYSINLGELTFAHPNGSTYRNIDGNGITFPYLLNPGATVGFLIESETAGSLANVADAIFTTVPTISLQSTLSGVSVLYHQVSRSGYDEELDDRLKERCRLSWARRLARINLIDDGVKAAALEAAPAVTTVSVDSSNPRGQGTFDVYIAGLDATSSVDDVTDVQAALDLQTFGRNNTPKTCMVYAAPEVILDLNCTVYFTGIAASAWTTNVDAAMTEYVRSIPCGGFQFGTSLSNVVPINDLETVVRNAVLNSGATRCTVKFNNPTANVTVLSRGKVVRGTWNFTAISINQ